MIKGFIVHETEDRLVVIRKPAWVMRILFTFLLVSFLMIMGFGREFLQEIAFREIGNMPGILLTLVFCILMAMLVLFTLYFWCRREVLTVTPSALKYRLSALLPLKSRDIPVTQLRNICVRDNHGRGKSAHLDMRKIEQRMKKTRGYENDDGESPTYELVFVTTERSLHCFWGCPLETAILPLLERIKTFLKDHPVSRDQPDHESCENRNRISRWKCYDDGQMCRLTRRGMFSPCNFLIGLGIALFWNGIAFSFLLRGIHGALHGNNPLDTLLFGWFLAIFSIPFVCIGLALVAVVLSLFFQPLHSFKLLVSNEGIRFKRTFFGIGTEHRIPAEDIDAIKITYNRKPNQWKAILDPEAIQVNGTIPAPYRIQLLNRERKTIFTIPWLYENEAVKFKELMGMSMRK